MASTTWLSVRMVGALLPPEVLAGAADATLIGSASSDYHLGGEAPREAATRAWSHLTGAYRRLRDELIRLPAGDPAVGLTRDRWLMLVLDDLGYGRVPTTGAGGLSIAGRRYPISHLWGATPIHLLGWNVPLDARTRGVEGAATRAPHAMVQEALNRTDEHLWAIVANGRVLRLVRDSTTLTGAAYVEFDLEAMFDAEAFADFVLLYLLAHQSRVEVPAGRTVRECWLERWRTTAITEGIRARELLHEGVTRAVATLATGFTQHPANTALRAGLANASAGAAGPLVVGDDGVPVRAVRVEDLHSAVLRSVYRLLFWAVVEARDALHDPDATAVAKQHYADHYSFTHLRSVALRRRGDAHDDRWRAVRVVLDALGRAGGEHRLGLPALGGLFSTAGVDVLAGAHLSNSALLDAIRDLGRVQPKNQARQLVDFAHLGSEELGSVYESLLELVPRYDPVSREFTLESLAGNDRKTSGSYYTPSDLVELVLDTALDPVLDDAEKSETPETALLAVTVCDPAVGSGHFLVASARRIAGRLAEVRARSRQGDASAADVHDAMHDVIARCVYGVDLNPMAADLAKVSLWMEAMSPGRPLSFLDHHVKVGNALLGTTPRLLAAGIPDAAYKALTGDDKPTATSWRKNNVKQRAAQGDLFDEGAIPVSNNGARESAEAVRDRVAAATTLADLAWAEQRYRNQEQSEGAVRARRTADAWCAAFLTRKQTDTTPITHDMLQRIGAGTATSTETAAVDALATRHRLFHWYLEFPDVFVVPDHGPAKSDTGWTGGFTAMLGNPPWDRVKLQEKEFFASRAPDIANASTKSARGKAIAALEQDDPGLLAEFEDAQRLAEEQSHLLRSSGRYPLTGVGDVNTYSVFAEHFRSCVSPAGRTGIITPTGLATDATTAPFFADTVRARRLAAFYDFENEARIFPGVHNQLRFAVSSMSGGEPIREVRLAFYTRFVTDVPARRFALAPEEVLALNPNTGTMPVFRTRLDAEITLACYQRHPVLIRDGAGASNPWGLKFHRLFDMAIDSGTFESPANLEARSATFNGWAWQQGEQQWLPLYEAKMLSHYNDRYSTYEGATQAQLNKGTLPRITADLLNDPNVEPRARHWVADTVVTEHIPHSWDRGWFIGWRDIARASDARTFVPSVLPRSAVGDKFLLAMPLDPAHAPLLQAVWSSLVFDYVARQKISGTGMKYFITKQLACPEPAAFPEQPAWCATTLDGFVRPRVAEMTYTSHRLRPYAVDVLSPLGIAPGGPFRWVPERREQLRAELDAAMLHLYGLDRSDVEHILDSFFVVEKYERRDHGEFRTKRLVLAAYDAMAEAARTGTPFTSALSPAPGDGPRHP